VIKIKEKLKKGLITEIATNDAMPSSAKSVIKLILNLLSNIYVKTVLLKCLIHSITTIQEKKTKTL
jgi:hypothetical protein